MPRTLICECGDCKKCNHRDYMRRYYHERRNAVDVLRDKSYGSRSSGGKVVVSCSWCERSLETTVRTVERHKGVRYCSPACKGQARAAITRHRRASAKPARRCLHCGSSMPQAMRADARYCSATCNSAAHQQTRKASAKVGARQSRIDRASIIERDEGRCHICGGFPGESELTLDHIVPLARGGKHTHENLAVACLSCNCAKGARLLTEA
jgi:5-methylcytosine-specific restriction endonuclease McrA